MDEIKVPETMANMQSGVQDGLVQPLTERAQKLSIDWNRKTVIIVVAIVAAGVLSGYGLYVNRTSGTVRLAGKDVTVVSTPTEEGVKDASTFKDTATGMVKENDGKITNEGTHILVRGDASQNVYLTSSVIDLSKYADKKVQVWGETFRGQKAGWLMDVGRIKVAQ